MIYSKKRNQYNTVRSHNNTAKRKNLRCELTFEEWQEIFFIDFKSGSAISCASYPEYILILEHVIPLSWGHGGTYKGNVIPLTDPENMSISNRNPISYLNDDVLEYLAKQNDLTLEEYISFVNWCEQNKRLKKECRMYKGTYNSLEVWKSLQYNESPNNTK